MHLFDVYPLWDIEPVKGLDTTLWDKDGSEYTDCTEVTLLFQWAIVIRIM